MQGRGRGNVAAERLCGALFVGLTTLKGYFYTNLGGTLLAQIPRAFRVVHFALNPTGSELAGSLKERIQFRYSPNFFLRVEPLLELSERRDVGVGPQARASKADGVGRQKFTSLDGSQ